MLRKPLLNLCLGLELALALRSGLGLGYLTLTLGPRIEGGWNRGGLDKSLKLNRRGGVYSRGGLEFSGHQK